MDNGREFAVRQRAYCDRDDHGGTTDEERDHWCAMYHWVQVPKVSL